VLTEWGFRVELQETATGRPNVIGRIGATRTSGGRALLLNGHLDTVGVEGMVHAPWDAAVRDGRIFGRGATDMKAGVAAMCAAAARAADDGLAGEVIVAAVTDEEFHSIGTRRLLESGLRADAAIVTEPTRLAVCPAHRGFAWLELVVHGRAAHGSRWDIGVDAIALASLVVAELEQYQTDVLAGQSHPLLGRPSLHTSLVSGGIGLSTYPDRCSVQFERRTLPGETPALFVREVEAACARVRARRPELQVEVRPGFSQQPNDVSRDDPIVRALLKSLELSHEPARIEGLACWTDAALLSAAGIPAVCFGPGDIALAHAAEEYVLVREIECAVEVLTSLIRDWFRTAS
jgi:acetylornithine deacetylase